MPAPAGPRERASLKGVRERVVELALDVFLWTLQELFTGVYTCKYMCTVHTHTDTLMHTYTHLF